MTLSAAQFDDAMAGFTLGPQPRVAVAVSGGGDSMALCLLLRDWCAARGGVLQAFTVDHGLRAESRAEAEVTAARLSALGIPHEILTWKGDKPTAGIQDAARRARYALLLSACRAGKFPVLALAHNAEDQIETFWMRLSHGSGLDGLAGMAADRRVDGLRLIRPLLSFTRAQLRDICRDGGIEWIEDPSNENEKFLRVRLRGFEDVLAGEGLTPQRLSQTLQKLAVASDALSGLAAAALARSAVGHAGGFVTLDRAAFSAEHAEIQRRIVEAALSFAGGNDYPPESGPLARLCTAMRQPDFGGATLAGVEVFAQGPAFYFCRERAAAEPPRPLTEGMVWDNRFRVTGVPDGESLSLGCLDEEGVSRLRKKKEVRESVLQALEALPGRVRRVLPTLWQGENPVAVPCLSYAEETVSALRLIPLRPL